MDLNADGVMDVLSGRYMPGVVTFFEGEAPKTISGSRTAAGGPGAQPVIGTFKAGVQIEEPGMNHQDMKTWMATTNTADIDGDGDQDLVIGNIYGDVFVNVNAGNAKSAKFGTRVPLTLADGKPVKLSHKSDPLPVDWDGDGILDLVVGDEWAAVFFFRGTGSKSETGLPTFEAGVPIVPGKEKNLVPGFRVRVETADWNNDGKLDLLVGNCENQGSNLAGNVYVFLRK